MASGLRQVGRQVWAYGGAVLLTVTAMVLVDGRTGPWFYGIPPYGFGAVPATEVVGLIIACTLIGFVAILPPFLLARWLAARRAAARGRPVGPLAAGLSGLAAVVPVVIGMDLVLLELLFRPDLYNLSFAAGGGLSGGLIYWALGGYPGPRP